MGSWRLLLCLLLAGFLGAQSPLHIVAGFDRSYAPYEYLDEQGNPAGFTVDLIREVAKERDWELELRAMAWSELRRAFERGEVDVLTGVAWSPERARTMAFSMPHSSITYGIVTRKGEQGIRREQDLYSRVVLAEQEDSVYEYLVPKGIPVWGRPTPGEALGLLSGGRGDCAVASKLVALYVMNRNHLTNLQLVPGSLLSQKYCFAVRKSQEFLLAQMDESLLILRENGTLDAVYDRNLGRLTAQEVPVTHLVRRTLPLLGALLLGTALVVILLWTRSLRRLVKLRTRHLQRLNAIAESINRSEVLDELLEAILRESRFIQGVESAEILVLDSDRDIFRCRASLGSGFGHDNLPTIELTPEDVEARYVQGAEVLADDILLIRSTTGRRAEEKVAAIGVSKSMLVLRIRHEDHVVGFLLYSNLHDPDAITVGDLDLLKSLKSYFLSAFQKALHLERLERAKLDAERATRFKSDFLANMSHEIRTPMNAILGFTALGLRQDFPPKALDYFRKISQSGRHLLHIINDILDISKIEAGHLELESVPFRLGDVLDQVMDLFAQPAAEKDLELVLSLAPAVPDALVGDPLRLGQVLVNLVGNALKFTERGYIRVRVEAEEARPDRVRLSFQVQDTGLGMTREQQGRLFKAFVQGDSSTTRTHGGTGLGLAISRTLVERMQGTFSVQSEPGIGSTFTFTCEFQRPTGSLEERRPTEGLRLLVVDDHAPSREALEEMLQGFGFLVTASASGEEALEELRRTATPYDLVLMDWKMPGLDGVETSRRIKADPRFTPLPEIIMVTGCDREEALAAAREGSFRGVLSKPVSPSHLLDSVLDVLGRSPSTSGRMPAPSPAAEPRLRGARVLVVDDNLINRQVAEEILKSAGVEVVLAASGPEAVRLAEREAFDAVLMDIQMPEMDGYAAAEAIRRLPGRREFPILAMTAHALPGYREECLAAGMNDYIPKPVDPETLFAVLGQWIPGVAAPPAAGPEPPLVLPGIDGAKALRRMGGNRRLLLQLLESFAGEAPGQAAALGEALACKDWQTAGRLAHTLKGVAGNLSAERLHRASAALEIAVRDRDEEAMAALCAAVQAEVAEVAGGTRPEPRPVETRLAGFPRGRLEPHLGELYRQLRIGSPDAEQPLQAIQERLQGHPLGPSFSTVGECLATYDFPSALSRLEDLERWLEPDES